MSLDDDQINKLIEITKEIENIYNKIKKKEIIIIMIFKR